MRSKTLFTAILAGLLAGANAISFADDSKMERHPVTSSPGQTAIPEPVAEHAYIQFLNFYVPAQKSDGTLKSDLLEAGIEYYNIDEDYVETRPNAKPQIAFSIYGPIITFDEDYSNLSVYAFPGHGRRDAWASASLDDGETWKKTNLSDSADRSSYTLDEAMADPGFPQAEFVVTRDTPVTTAATYAKSTLTVSGTDAFKRAYIEVRNAITLDVVGSVKAKNNGTFTFTANKLASPPCTVQAGYSDSNTWGPYLKVSGAPSTCVGSGSETLTRAYPGDVVNGVHAMHGNKILAAWQSKYCRGGSPAWGAEFIAEDLEATTTYLQTTTYPAFDPAADLYLTDLFGVAGSQGETDYREQESYPGEYDDVGVVPHSCLWTARGVLREDPDNEGATEVVWLGAERLTSGRRDVNRIEVGCVAGAGCAVSWQEDPEGLRPGEGEGPGVGWSGSTTHSKTDLWFSFIRWEHFDVIDTATDNPPAWAPLGDLSLDDLGTNRPRGFPMMVPVRLTNNDRCSAGYYSPGVTTPDDKYFSYCNIDVAAAYGIKDQCAAEIVPANSAGNVGSYCVVDTDGDGAGDLPNIANTAASRPRLSLQPRDSDGDGVTDDAWVMVYAEEDKGLGNFGFPNNVAWNGSLTSTGVSCGDPDLSLDDECIEADTGKRLMWYTFAMGTPQTSAALDKPFGLVNNLVVQGAQLNQPAVNWRTGTFYPPMSTEQMWDFGEYDYLVFKTDISRRSSMMAQPVGKGASELVALPLWKQGIMHQGGPADIMARRFAVIDEDETADGVQFDQSARNPYDVANMECAWYDGLGGVTPGLVLFGDGSNPYYPKGLCTAPAINLSARTPYECSVEGASQADGICNSERLSCTMTAFGQLCIAEAPTDGSFDDPTYRPGLDRLLSWYECPGANGDYSGTRDNLPACGEADASTILGSNLDDQSWYNPVDIAKGHRGFLDGDFVQMLYAWSPNYKQNAVGKDRYDLYVRRSFDGGVTWTTTPASFTASDGVTYQVGEGTVTCESLRDGKLDEGGTSQDDSQICTTYGAGEAEQSRNVSQLRSKKITILDPRFTPTGTNLAMEVPVYAEGTCPEWYKDADGICESDHLIFDQVVPTDVRNPSRFFVVYETGDNATAQYAEADPLDLFYGRAEVFGDHYTVWAEMDTGYGGGMLDCYPNNPYDTDTELGGLGFCNEFDDLEGKQGSESGEASLTASAAGDFLYAVWAQENFDEHEFVDSDSMFRRVWYLDGYIAEDESKTWTLPGTGDQTNQ